MGGQGERGSMSEEQPQASAVECHLVRQGRVIGRPRMWTDRKSCSQKVGAETGRCLVV